MFFIISFKRKKTNIVREEKILQYKTEDYIKTSPLFENNGRYIRILHTH